MAQQRSIYSSDGTSSSSSEDDETRPPSPPDQEEQSVSHALGASGACDWQEHAGDETEGETEGETDEDGSSTPGSDDADGDDHRSATEEADMKRHVAELVVARCPRSARRNPRRAQSMSVPPCPLCPSPLQTACTHARMEQAAENEACRALISQLEREREQLWAAVANEREEHRVQLEREREFEKQKLVDVQVQLFCPEQPNRA